MPRSRTIGSLAVGLLAVLACTSCTGSKDHASSTVPSAPATPASASAIHTSPKPKTTPPATIKAACPLLPVSDLKRLLGGGAQMTATEQSSRKPDSNTSQNECVYGKSGGPAAFSLTVETTTDPGLSPAQVVANLANAEKTPAQKVSGVGEAAGFFTPGDGTSNMTAAKRSAGQVRIVIFITSSVVPEQKFSDVEKLVLSRI